VLDEPEGLAEGGGELPASSISPVRARSFRYPERSPWKRPFQRERAPEAPVVLRDVDLALRRGEVVRAGRSERGGKTTLNEPWCRDFADPTAGEC